MTSRGIDVKMLHCDGCLWCFPRDRAAPLLTAVVGVDVRVVCSISTLSDPVSISFLPVTLPLLPGFHFFLARDFAPGGLEESGEQRVLLEVTQSEPQGHIALEKEKAAQEQRPPRHGYRDVPLTGCHQSVMPTYRLPGAFGNITEPDERRLFRVETAAAARRWQDHLLWKDEAQPWVLDESRRVVALQLPDGRVAQREDTFADAKAWARAFGRDVRGVFFAKTMITVASRRV